MRTRALETLIRPPKHPSNLCETPAKQRDSDPHPCHTCSSSRSCQQRLLLLTGAISVPAQRCQPPLPGALHAARQPRSQHHKRWRDRHWEAARWRKYDRWTHLSPSDLRAAELSSRSRFPRLFQGSGPAGPEEPQPPVPPCGNHHGQPALLAPTLCQPEAACSQIQSRSCVHLSVIACCLLQQGRCNETYNVGTSACS